MTTSDIDLVYLVKTTGDDSAFSELVRRHQARLRAFLTRLSGNQASVDDIAQMSLIKAHRAIADFRGGGSFRSWLFAIAYREFLQSKRRDAAAARIKDAAAASAPDVSAAPTDDLALDLKSALAKLPENERASLLLCDAAGFSHSEAAAALGAPLGSVKSWVLRGREKMRALLSPSDDAGHAGANPKQNGVAYAR